MYIWTCKINYLNKEQKSKIRVQNYTYVKYIYIYIPQPQLISKISKSRLSLSITSIIESVKNKNPYFYM